ncbi:FAD-dependent oxidoreductase [Patescibacteria group bacterium]|nr:FAD-dependent oxidoreductase [Patescibacteria group bacterium]
MYDLAIIGGGPAGVAAGVYAARKQLKTVFIAESIGGQSTDSTEIQNWIGTPAISGIDLAKSLEAHLKAYAGEFVDLKLGIRGDKVEKIAGGFSITTSKETLKAKAVLISTGGSRRKLTVPGAAEFENKGLTYCASCDGPLFAGQDVIVVGAGNAGFESAAQLLAYCKSVTLLNRSAEFLKADAATVQAVIAHANFKALSSTVPVEIKGGPFVKSMVVKNSETGETTELAATGIFVEIGMISATGLVEGLVDMDEYKHIKVDPRNQRSSVEGIWSAGDCTDGLYHQNNIAAGDAVKALEDIYYWIKSH